MNDLLLIKKKKKKWKKEEETFCLTLNYESALALSLKTP